MLSCAQNMCRIVRGTWPSWEGQGVKLVLFVLKQCLCMARIDLKPLIILLPQLPGCWNARGVPLSQALDLG